MRRLLVLRPEPGASATLAKARQLGLDAVAVPLFEVEPVAWDAPDARAFDALLLTSANALRHGGEQLAAYRSLPVHAVGEATAEAARDHGFEVAATGSAGVDALLAGIDPSLRLLHLCGLDRTGSQRPVTAVAVYQAKAIAAPDLGELADVVALVHSPRAARRFAELVGKRRTISIAAISPAAAEAAGGGWASIAAADEPNDDALLALASRLCNKPPQR